MRVRKLINIISFTLLAYLLLDIGSKLDIAPTKNDSVMTSKRMEINNLDNIELAKSEAIKNLNTIKNIHKGFSNDSKRQVLIIVVLIIAQGYLSFTKQQ